MQRFSLYPAIVLVCSMFACAVPPRSLEELLNSLPIGAQMLSSPLPGFTRQGKRPSPMIADTGKIDGQETKIMYVNEKVYGIHFGSQENIRNGDNNLARAKYDEFYKMLLAMQKKHGGELMWNPKTKYGNYEYFQADLICTTFKISVYSGSGSDRMNPYTKSKEPGVYSVYIVSKGNNQAPNP